jgi:hypothetical protein
MGRLRDHSHTQAVWRQTQDWLQERNDYLTAVNGLARRIWQDVWQVLDQDRANGSLAPKTRGPLLEAAWQQELAAPNLPADIFVVPVVLATHQTLLSVGVDRRSLAANLLQPAVDRTGGDGGYVKRERLNLFPIGRPTSPKRDFDFVRDYLPGALRGWSRRAGELQERWRLELAGAPAVMDLCRQCADLSRTRQALVATFGSLDPNDLRDGQCEQCRQAVVASPQG